MSIDALPDHIRKPHLRPIQPLPIQKDGKRLVALRDPTMLQPQTMVVPVPAMQLIQQFQGNHTIEELAERFSSPPEQITELAKGLDKLGLLWGPTFEEMEAARWNELRERGAFPAHASSSLGDDAEACRAQLEQYFADTEDPELEEAPTAIVAPHLDYGRGWPNYAAAYYGLRNMEKPDRVVVLGTNHFGLGDGVVLTELGFETPLGRCAPDADVLAGLNERLGRAGIVDQMDHLPEHSIELQVPWIQHCFGDVPIVAALVPDPIRDMIEDDDKRVSLEPFVDALGDTLAAVGGRTFYIASADLSHVGPQFGEPRPVDDQRSMDVERHDREMMSKYIDGDAEEFVAAMKWNKNPTRWCSIGNMTALLMLTKPEDIELIDYRQARDERGIVMVSSCAMAMR